MNAQMIAHDMRTPLSALLLAAESAEMSNDADELRRALDVIRRNSLALSKMLDDLTSLGDLYSASNATLHLATCQVDSIVTGALERVQELCRAKSQTIDFTSLHLPPIVADCDRLVRVLTNLLSNAIKFSPASSTISVRVKARANDAHESVIFSVIDEGPGIAAPDIDRVFTEGVSIASSSRSSSGLGLAICRELVEVHGGRIWVETDRKSGCCISFSIPRNLIPDRA